MGKTIFITEKPSVAQEYKKVLKISPKGKTNGYVEGHSSVLNKDVQITWAVGHLITLASVDEHLEGVLMSAKELKENKRRWSKDNLPILPKKYLYKPSASTYDQFKVVKSLYTQKDIDAIYYAGDSGREGIYIQALIRNQIFKTSPKFTEKVVWIDSFTEEEILRGIREAKPYSAYQNMIDSGYERAIHDYLIGMNFTEAITLSCGTLLNTGRVMTPTLAMVVDRQKEIDEFKPTDYFGINAEGEGHIARWKSSNPDDNRLYNENGFKDEKDALDLIKSLNSEYKVKDVKTVKKTEYAPLLFNLADLQSTCAKMFHITPAKTLEIAQSLYEKKMTTYPRTDARVLSSAVAKELLSEGMKVPPKYVDDSKITDHYAIIPTRHKVSLSGLEAQVFEVINNRFKAIFMPPYVYNTISVVYENNDELFYESAKEVIDLGYRALYDEKETTVPDVPKKGTALKMKATVNKMTTTPPSYYTTGSLILAMEKAGKLVEDEALREQIKTCGIGTSATRANIIEKLEKGEFITIEKSQKITATEKGKQTILITRKYDYDLTSPVKTAEMEESLNDIALGKVKMLDIRKDFEKYIAETVEKILKSDNGITAKEFNKSIKGNDKAYECPVCHTPLKNGQYGYYCPNKDFSFPKEMCKAKLTERDLEKILEKGKTNTKKFISKAGKPFSAYLKLNNGKLEFAFKEK